MAGTMSLLVGFYLKLLKINFLLFYILNRETVTEFLLSSLQKERTVFCGSSERKRKVVYDILE